MKFNPFKIKKATFAALNVFTTEGYLIGSDIKLRKKFTWLISIGARNNADLLLDKWPIKMGYSLYG